MKTEIKHKTQASIDMSVSVSVRAQTGKYLTYFIYIYVVLFNLNSKIHANIIKLRLIHFVYLCILSFAVVSCFEFISLYEWLDIFNVYFVQLQYTTLLQTYPYINVRCLPLLSQTVLALFGTQLLFCYYYVQFGLYIHGVLTYQICIQNNRRQRYPSCTKFLSNQLKHTG